MQKKIIALAVAAVASSAAFAQSNVTVYGVADMYVANVGVGSTGVKTTALNSGGLSGSRIGFKGVEDLGNGTKALFTLEYALNLDRNAGVGSDAIGKDEGATVQSRQAFVGLTGDYGTVIAGRLQSLAYNHNAAFNPTFGTGVDTQASVVAGVNGVATSAVSAGSNLAIATAERLDNAVAYVAPAIGGVTFAAAHTTQAIGKETKFSGVSANEGDAPAGSVRASELSASYGNGPLAIGGVYRTVHRLATAGDNSVALGGSYDFGIVKLLANVAQAKNTNVNFDGGNTSADKYSLTNLSAVVPVSSKGAVIASLATAKKDSSNEGVKDSRATTFAVLYKHSLSARTALYGGFAQASGNDDTRASLVGQQANAANTVGGGKASAVLAGINHSF